jgi:hypothetical protein
VIFPPRGSQAHFRRGPQEGIVSQPLQSAVTLHLGKKCYFGTAWSIDGKQLLVTSRGAIAPGSHASLEWELDCDGPMEFITVRADVVIQGAGRADETDDNTRRYAVELLAMSHADQHTLGRWLEARRGSGQVDPDQPTDIILVDAISLLGEEDAKYVDRDSFHSDRAPEASMLAQVTNLQVRFTRARVNTRPGRVCVTWTSWAELEADWNSSLSRGKIYVRDVDFDLDVLPGEALVVVATMPDGRRALLSGRLASCVRGVALINVSMGEQTRALLAAPRAPTPSLPPRHSLTH